MTVLFLGFLFGAILQSARLNRFDTISGMATLENYKVAKAIALAIGVGVILLNIEIGMGLATYHIKPLLLGGIVMGGLIFGTGMAVLGYCPGTVVISAGEGSLDAGVGILGGLAGGLIYTLLLPTIGSALGPNLGTFSLFSLLGTTPAIFYPVMIVCGLLFIGIAFLVHRLEKSADTSWIFAGSALALLNAVVCATAVADHPIGASSGFPYLADTLCGVTDNAYFKQITKPGHWELIFLAGAMLSGTVVSVVRKEFKFRMIHANWERYHGHSWPKRACWAFAGGFILIFGARMAGGCTSGHVISGGMQLAVSSLTFAFFVFAGLLVTGRLFYQKNKVAPALATGIPGGGARGKSFNCLLAGVVWLGLAGAGFGEAEKILGTSPIRGGLCVIVGSGDGALAAEFVASGGSPFVVHGLEADAAKVDASRKMLLDSGLYGRVTIEAWDEATLPYADNLVSLLVIARPGKIPPAEMLRVLRPFGEMYVKQGGEWQRTVKLWPEGMDDWTHWRHGPDGNPVSKDRFVDVSARLQWTIGRQLVSERTFAVYSGGRMFAFEGGQVVARDAFNGMPLWSKRAYTGFGQDVRELGYHHNLGMIAADGARVYFSTPDGVFKAHDATSEKLLMSYTDAGTPLNILCVHDGTSEWGTLVLSDVTSIRALDAKSGKLLWKRAGSLVKHPVASQQAVFYVTGDFLKKEKVSIVSCDLKTGKTLWEKADTKDPCPWPERVVCCSLGYGMLAYQAKVPYRWPGGWRKYYEQYPGRKKDEAGIYVVSAATGEVLLETDAGGSSARHGEWNEACWVNECLLKTGRSRDFGSAIVMQPIKDLKGPPVVFNDNDVGDRGFGHCYPPTITERFYLYGQLNFVDLKTHEYKSSQITRGGCNTFRPGYLPANGLIYVHPKHCGCFPMLDGVAALASAYADPPKEEMKLVKGPAWGVMPVRSDYSREWPMYRHDSDRSGGTTTEAPAELKVLWTADIKTPDYRDPVAAEWLHHQYTPGRVTQPVIAGGMVYVAQPDTQRLVALDAATGQPKWEFFANGRIDTPPTVHEGMCFVGSRSGWLFNVRASDGQLIWKLRIAPYDRRIAMFGQVESPTPVPGSVAVINGLVYAAAGLHPQADGGVRVVCVEPATGRIVWQNKYTTLGYEDRKWGSYTVPLNQDPWRRMGVREYEPFDLPVHDGDSVAVSRWLFDLKTGNATLNKMSSFFEVKNSGVFMRRRAWSYAPRTTDRRTPLQVACGNSVFSDTAANPRLFRVDFEKGKPFDPEWLNAVESGLTSSAGRQLKLGAKWKIDGVEGGKAPSRAMVVAGKHLYVIAPDNQLETYSTEDGKRLAKMKVEAPVWDGLAAADGRLYLSVASGRVLCLGR